MPPQPRLAKQAQEKVELERAVLSQMQVVAKQEQEEIKRLQEKQRERDAFRDREEARRAAREQKDEEESEARLRAIEHERATIATMAQKEFNVVRELELKKNKSKEVGVFMHSGSLGVIRCHSVLPSFNNSLPSVYLASFINSVPGLVTVMSV